MISFSEEVFEGSPIDISSAQDTNDQCIFGDIDFLEKECGKARSPRRFGHSFALFPPRPIMPIRMVFMRNEGQ